MAVLIYKKYELLNSADDFQDGLSMMKNLHQSVTQYIYLQKQLE